MDPVPRTDAFDKLREGLRHIGQPSSDYDLNKDVVLPPGRKITSAAVLVALVQRQDTLDVILTKRSPRLQHHPGQIAFPGGKQDAEDLDLSTTALREAEEEIGLVQSNVEILGQMAPHETVTGYSVTPVVARVLQPFDPRLEPGEVAEMFCVPLPHLLRPENFAVEGRRWRGQMRHYFTVPYGPYYIWGATARMLRALADQVST